MRWSLLTLVLCAGCDQLFGIDDLGPAGPADATRPGDLAGDGAGRDDAMPVHPCFDGSFDSGTIDTTRFVVTMAAGGTVGADSGGVAITYPMAVAVANYGSVDTTTAYDLTGGDVQVDVIEIVADKAEAELYMYADAAHSFEITVSPTTIEFDLYNGVSSSFERLATTAYSGLPVHLRLHHDDVANMVVYEAMTSTGTVTHPLPPPFPVTQLTAGFAAGTYAAASQPGHGRLDNFVVKARGCL